MITNYKLEWTVKHGPEKGEKASAWFAWSDPLIDYLIEMCGAEVIDRI